MVSSCCLSRFQNSKMCFRRRHTSRRSQRCICQTNRYKAKLAFTTVYNNDPMCWCFRISVLYVLRCCVDVSCSLSVMSVTKLQTVIVWICFVLKWALRISVYDALSMLYFKAQMPSHCECHFVSNNMNCIVVILSSIIRGDQHPKHMALVNMCNIVCLNRRHH